MRTLHELAFVLVFSVNAIGQPPSGLIETIAGSGGAGYSGDGGPATSAQLYSSGLSLAVDADGDLFIADSQACRIRKVSGGIITTDIDLFRRQG